MKRSFQFALVIVLLAASFASVENASAWSSCDSYITVQWGDTLSGIAAFCGTTVQAIRTANPGLGWWLYAGQKLYIPNGNTPQPQTYSTYKVKWGDTLKKIAIRYGVSVKDILATNPQIYNPSLIYVGQVINLPVSAPLPPSGPPPSTSYSTVKINYKYGLYIRNAPNGKVIASAVNKTAWKYDQSSITVDSKGNVWAQIKLSPPINGYDKGWLLVMDRLGNYFTDPPVDNN